MNSVTPVELTGLYTRRALDKKRELALEISQSDSIFLILVNLDNFKQANDKFGHAIGDKLLVEFSRVINASLRQTDFVIR